VIAFFAEDSGHRGGCKEGEPEAVVGTGHGVANFIGHVKSKYVEFLSD
jgi:hypothetical protein